MVKSSQATVRIGVVSDTHGYLDPQVLVEFAGVTHIIHAGDIMDTATLEALRGVAPVTAVAGNMDDGKLGKLPREVLVEVGGVRIVVGHKRKRLLKRLAAGKIEGSSPRDDPPGLVVWGHDHVPAAEWVEGVLYLDPGTASAPHEEDDDPTVAVVEVGAAGLEVRFVPLARRAHDEG
jgi:putative phosphoesterase